MSSVPTYPVASSLPIRGLHHFAYRCRDCEETRRFYEDLLGLPLVAAVKAEHVPSTGEGCAYVQLYFAMGDGSCIAFFDLGDGDSASPAPDRRRWASHLALRVDSPAALHAAKARLAATGVEVLGPVDRGTIQSIYFFDPNGVRLELATPTPSNAEMGELAAQARRVLQRWMTRPRTRLTASAPGVDTGGADGRRPQQESSEGDVTMENEMPSKNTICVWYDHDAEEAARFYARTFPDSAVGKILRAPGDFPSGKKGDVLTVEFTVAGIPCVGLNGGPEFKHNEAFSFQIATDDQAETDRLWNAIVGNGGQESACGWCKDKWGVSWQITPRVLLDAISDPDPAAAKRAFDAMMEMRKIDIAAIEAARRG